MGWRNKLKKFAPIALKLGIGDEADKGEAVSNLIEALQGSLAGSPQKASIDAVRIVATAVDDHQEDIEALKARNRALEERLLRLEQAGGVK